MGSVEGEEEKKKKKIPSSLLGSMYGVLKI